MNCCELCLALFILMTDELYLNAVILNNNVFCGTIFYLLMCKGKYLPV